MSTIDLSRHVSDHRQHYAGVRHQQGRVLTDADFNEAAMIESEELRRTRIHAIGAYGSPDAGFLPKALGVGAGGKLDFSLSAGELYLGGLRLEMNADERFLEQKDWLDFDPAIDAPAPPAAGTTRTDLVWIEAWQQPVTATEDSELFEVALGGPDTSVRWRTMRRVHVLPGVTGSACPDAWAAALASFTAMGTLAADMEMTTMATLTVDFTAPADPGDLCAPALAGGYLGAENQAIRVQMVDAAHYCWGFDNAAPLYRAKIADKGGARILITLQTPPRDAAHWPLAGQVVELLPWSAVLANGEKTAGLAGHLCKVAVSYDPDTQRFEIDLPLPAGFDRWKTRSDVASFFDNDAAHDFLYLRVWNRGDDLASPAAIPIGTGTLGHTGLSVTFAGGPLRPADHWIVAARPAAPAAIVPWQLTLPSGAPPSGIHRYRAPIGLIAWTGIANGGATGVVIDDCRPPFLPLTRIRGCCTVTVGDGIESFGMFASIQAAIDSLPPTGGQVCLLPGLFQEAVRIDARHNVTLHGCGPRSRIAAPDTEGAGSTAIAIVDSEDICIENLAIEGGGEAAVLMEEVHACRIADCLVQYRDIPDRISPWSTIFARGRSIEIIDNIVEPLPQDNERIFCRTAAPLRAEPADSARGGIQLAGGCRDILVRGNVIVGGMGNGITLGSILRIDEAHPDGDDIPDIATDDPCASCDPTDSSAPPETPDGRTRYESGGDLYAITICDNVITRHGANGIAVVRFFGLSEDGLVLVSVHGLAITDNQISACLRQPVATAGPALQLLLGYGGISLAFVTDLAIEGNVIAYNGRDWLDPVCGIFALAADGLRIEHNLVRGNGRPAGETAEAARPGIRAGIHVWLAISLNLGRGAKYAASVSAGMRGLPGVDQLCIHANQVEQPLGRALFLLGAGPMQISNNRLVSEALSGRATDRIARTVLVANLGFSREWTMGLLMALLLLANKQLADKRDVDLCEYVRLAVRTRPLPVRLPTGKLSFVDNQVSFLMPDAPPGFDLASVLLASLDDVSACDNQIECHGADRLVLADLMAIGFTVRTSDNRMAETWGRAFLSLLSYAMLNSAADNQTTHCIKVNGMRTGESNNLVLAEAFCDDFCAAGSRVNNHVATGAYRAIVPKS